MLLNKVGKYLLVFLLILALASPSAFCVVNGTETNAFESLSIVIIEGEQTLSGKDASTIRFGMDKYGNNDSMVSALEISEFEARYEEYVKEFGNEYTLNGNEGEFTNIVATFKNAEGQVNSSTEIIFEYQGRITFQGIDDGLDAYTYRLVNEGGDPNSTMEIQITVPRGYAIYDVQGIFTPETSDGNRTISGQTLTDANVVIGFEPHEEWDWLITPLLISGIISIILVAALAANHLRGGKAPSEQYGAPQGGEKGPPGNP